MALGLKKKKQKTAGAKSAAPKIEKPVPRMLSKQPAVSERRRRFVEAYLVSNNASDAARKAGYSVATAGQMGYALLKEPQIAAEIRERRAKLAEAFEVTAERVKAEVAKLAFANIDDFMKVGADGSPRVDFRTATRAQRAALASVTVEEFVDGRSDKRQVRRVKFTMNDKGKALENLMKHFGLLNETVQHDHKHEVTVIGALLQEIDAESRGRVIDHEPVKK